MANQNLHLNRIFLMQKRGSPGVRRYCIHYLWARRCILNEMRHFEIYRIYYIFQIALLLLLRLLNSPLLIGVFLLWPGLLTKVM